jgi:hypothetical protein
MIGIALSLAGFFPTQSKPARTTGDALLVGADRRIGLSPFPSAFDPEAGIALRPLNLNHQ